jgi:hypothetical protein
MPKRFANSSSTDSASRSSSISSGARPDAAAVRRRRAGSAARRIDLRCRYCGAFVASIVCRLNRTRFNLSTKPATTHRYSGAAFGHTTTAVCDAISSSDNTVPAAAQPANNESGSGSIPIRPQAKTALQTTRSGRSVKPPVRFKDFRHFVRGCHE